MDAQGNEFAAGDDLRPDVEIVIPVFNEEAELASHVIRLAEFVATQVPYRTRITIADNASTDRTAEIADSLAAALPDVRAVHLPLKGRGRALKQVWSASDATVLAYMDVDLSTDLHALLPLIAPLLSGHSELAIGSRLAPSARVIRGGKREVLSRGYNVLLRATLATRFSDAQCGFKAIRADRARQLLPLVADTGWFFDTELLVLAERAGLRIHEVPVDWVDDPDSRVDIRATVTADLRGILRLARALAAGRVPLSSIRDDITSGRPPTSLAGQLWRFAVVGIACTAAYLVLYLLLRESMPAQRANFIALALTAVVNTAINRRFTFGISGATGRWRAQAQGLIVFALGWALTAGALWLIDAHHHEARPVLEIAVLVLANLLATALRFALLRSWVFRLRPGRTPRPVAADPASLLP